MDNADSKALPPGLGATQRALRVQLRAHARQLGDRVHQGGEQDICRLVAECAYEHWHRMLFARYLAENNLLLHPEHGVPMSLADCREVAEEEGTDAWDFAARCASRMLPEIFRPEDPLLQVPFAPEHKFALERILAALPEEVFTADDSLGWVYQYWQTKRKDEVNASEVKIGGDELPAVTQLFTEAYMVQFLLHNTLGAWWVSRQAAMRGCKPAEVTLPGCSFEYLRFRDDGTPAAGDFPGWPERAGELKVLDPCCGSGHFLVAAFELLVRIQMHDEGLSARAACEAVLRDNLFGLELDARCTQIAAFNLALAAWKFPDAGGYRPLPQMHIACSGQGLRGRIQDWERLAGNDKRLRISMRWMYDKFHQAPDLGSLIDPTDTELGPSMGRTFEEVLPLLREALKTETVRNDAELTEQGVAAQGIARAAEILAGRYSLVTTNVPYLARGKHADPLKTFIDEHHSVAKADLATVFVHRMLKWVRPCGSLAIVSPQNWWFLTSYREFRGQLLQQQTWNLVATLGEEAWQSFGDRGPVAALMVLGYVEPIESHSFTGINALPASTIADKIQVLRAGLLLSLSQSAQYSNPDHRITVEGTVRGELLAQWATSYEGTSTGDLFRYVRFFWELSGLGNAWEKYIGSAKENCYYGGREQVLYWQDGKGGLRSDPGAYIKGRNAWGKLGVRVSQMRNLTCTLYTGELFDKNAASIVPRDRSHLPALLAFCSSEEFRLAVRRIDKAVKITIGTLVKVPFNLTRWQAQAERLYPNGLPEPYSNDPTQWLFKGDVATADTPHNLQVAVARLLGYRWPDQPADKLDALAVPDGIACLPALAGEPAAAERLRNLLAAAYGEEWSPAKQQTLLAAVEFAGKPLEDWLRDGFFEQHCRLFHNRPFLWHVWDGRKDGFAAIVNYHKLDQRTLNNLTHHHLALWIKRQKQAVENGESGADGRLAAAETLRHKLKLILEGEDPYDLFVRWKPPAKQPVGWDPDLNDGVRLNIRPFLTADVLRKKPNIKWSKDKGRDPETAPWYHRFGGDRINDHHLKLAEKQAARQAGGDA